MNSIQDYNKTNLGNKYDEVITYLFEKSATGFWDKTHKSFYLDSGGDVIITEDNLTTRNINQSDSLLLGNILKDVQEGYHKLKKRIKQTSIIIDNEIIGTMM